MKLRNILIIGMLAISCSNQKTSSEETNETTPENIIQLTAVEMKTANIQLGQPEKGATASFLKASGLVEAPPQNVVSISFPNGGYLVSTRLIPGMRIRKGQALAEMQDGSLIQMQQDYLVAKTKVTFLQKEFDRQKLLNSTKTASDKVLEQTESEYQTQKILMNSLREKLRLVHIDPASLNENTIRRSTMIYSPIDGYVSDVYANIGKYVNPSDVLFELVNPSQLHLTLKVFEKDVAFIEAGQKVKVNLVNVPGKTFDAQVSLISKNLDNDRSATVHCHFIRTGNDMLPGTFANATIEVRNHDGILVPEEAVVRWGDQDYVFAQKGSNQFEMVAITKGTTANGKTEIRNGLLENQTIIIKNAYTALMKMENKAE